MASNSSFLTIAITGLLLTILSHAHGAERRLRGDSTTRIVGGTTADPAAYPFFARVDHLHRTWCGGTLIRPDIVLTAAHCDAPSSVLSVVINAFTRDADVTAEGAEGHIPVNVVTRVAHPGYRGNTNQNDVALLKLSEPVWSVAPVRLNGDENVPAVGEELTTMGFGSTVYQGPGSHELQHTTVNALSQSDCQQMYRSYSIMEDVMLCAMIDGGGQDACVGDSGGPLITADGVQVGIVSWGVGCASADHPGVYTRISGVKDWIDDTLCTLSNYGNEACAPSNSPSQAPYMSPRPSYETSSETPSWSSTPSLVPSMAPSNAPSTVQEQGELCDDHPTEQVFVTETNSYVTCSSLAAMTLEDQGRACESANVRETCPRTCGLCPNDCVDREGTFDVEPGQSRTCEWLQSSERFHRIWTCASNEGARTICRSSCGCITSTLPANGERVGPKFIWN